MFFLCVKENHVFFNEWLTYSFCCEKTHKLVFKCLISTLTTIQDYMIHIKLF